MKAAIARATSATLALAAVAVTGSAATGCDPVTDDAIASLGPESPGVPPGPLHRPGQPCLLCHDGGHGHPAAFGVAGTVFAQPYGGAPPASGVIVKLTDATGASTSTNTNDAGNFYLFAGEFMPTYPMSVQIAPSGGAGIQMRTLVGRNGSCAACHTTTAGPASPGPVMLQLEDGGTPP